MQPSLKVHWLNHTSGFYLLQLLIDLCPQSIGHSGKLRLHFRLDDDLHSYSFDVAQFIHEVAVQYDF